MLLVRFIFNVVYCVSLIFGKLIALKIRVLEDEESL